MLGVISSRSRSFDVGSIPGAIMARVLNVGRMKPFLFSKRYKIQYSEYFTVGRLIVKSC